MFFFLWVRRFALGTGDIDLLAFRPMLSEVLLENTLETAVTLVRLVATLELVFSERFVREYFLASVDSVHTGYIQLG